MRFVRLFRAGVAGTLLAGSGAVFALDLPDGAPTRNGGLWAMVQTGTLSDGETTIDTEKVWEICLDPRADRALHELEVREQQARVAGLNERCEEPRPTVSGNMLSWTMHCSGPSPDDTIGKTEVRHTATFVTGDVSRAETIINRDNLIQSHGRFVTQMTRTGLCQSGWKPGDMMLMHWRVNGEETLKARQRRNLHDEIANHKASKASRLAR